MKRHVRFAMYCLPIIKKTYFILLALVFIFEFSLNMIHISETSYLLLYEQMRDIATDLEDYLSNWCRLRHKEVEPYYALVWNIITCQSDEFPGNMFLFLQFPV